MSASDKKGDGLALPLVATNVCSPDGWDFGWCVVDANKRVLGYCLTEKQSHQLADAANIAPASSDLAQLDHAAIVGRVESYFKRVRKLGGDTGECSAVGVADWLLWQEGRR